MKILTDRLRPAHRHGGGQIGIDAAHPGRVRTFGTGVEMRDLAKRMHAGIGTPGAMHAYRFCCDLTQGAFDYVLNGFAIRLRLPAQYLIRIALGIEYDK